ncbi:MAG: N-acetyltransferase [Ramlibacter sp.]|nr:N-acetyltransferase [Ramlibacter sp.]
MPLGYQLTLTETLLQQMGNDAPAVASTDWEVGRLVLAPEHRSDVEALRRCLSLAIMFAHSHTNIGYLYASCTHVLSRLYRRFAFTAFARDVPLPGGDKIYTLIRGGISQVSAALCEPQAVRQPQ